MQLFWFSVLVALLSFTDFIDLLKLQHYTSSIIPFAYKPLFYIDCHKHDGVASIW